MLDTRRKSITLDLDTPIQRSLKALAALKGISTRQYCQTAIDKALATVGAQGCRAFTTTTR